MISQLIVTYEQSFDFVILYSFGGKIVKLIFCKQAFNLKMYGKDYVWILQNHNMLWWKSSQDCDHVFLQKVMESLILVSDYNILLDNETAVSAMVIVFCTVCVFLLI